LIEFFLKSEIEIAMSALFVYITALLPLPDVLLDSEIVPIEFFSKILTEIWQPFQDGDDRYAMEDKLVFYGSSQNEV
jgi:hypothetical protein